MAITKPKASTSLRRPNRVLSPAFWRAWLRRPSFDVAEAVIRLRRLRGFSQSDLARRMGTKQPAIARLESGVANVRLSTLRDIATALDASVRVEIEPLEMKWNRVRSPWWKQLDEGIAGVHQTRILHQSIDSGFAYSSRGAAAAALVRGAPRQLGAPAVNELLVASTTAIEQLATQARWENEETKAS